MMCLRARVGKSKISVAPLFLHAIPLVLISLYENNRIRPTQSESRTEWLNGWMTAPVEIIGHQVRRYVWPGQTFCPYITSSYWMDTSCALETTTLSHKGCENSTYTEVLTQAVETTISTTKTRFGHRQNYIKLGLFLQLASLTVNDLQTTLNIRHCCIQASLLWDSEDSAHWSSSHSFLSSQTSSWALKTSK